MTADDPRLSRLETSWTLVTRTHGGDREATAELLPRYCRAVFRYLLVVVQNEGVAEELCQEFAYRFVRGDFRHARPEKGRFRDYVKQSVLHLAEEYRRKRQAAEKLITFDSRVLAAATVPPADPDAGFRRLWADGLVARAWAAFQAEADRSDSLTYEALRLRADDPARRSADIARLLGVQYGRELTTAAVRQLLHRGRERYAELLWRETAESLPSTDPDEVTAELADLGLLIYCRPVGTAVESTGR